MFDRLFNSIKKNAHLNKTTVLPTQTAHITESDTIKELNNTIRRLHHIIDSVPVNIYWKDLDGIYRGFNQHSMTTLQGKTKEDVIGKSLREILPYDTLENIQAIEETDFAIMSSGQSSKLEEQGLNKEKQPVTYLSVKEPLYDHDGAINGMVGISIDISELKQTESALQKAKEKAEAANRAKTEFISNMRHDLRTPFNGILGMAEILAQQENDPEKSEYIGYIVQSSKKLLDHLSEILEFTQLEEGRLPLLDKPFDLHQLIIDVSEMMQPSMTAKNLSFNVLISEDVPLSCVGDPSRTQRILMNLLSNAVKFTSQGQVCLSVMTHRDLDDTIIVSFEVKDTGIGIPEDKQDMVFEKFNRITSSYSGVYEGMGLGLHMVKNFLDELEGEVQLQSTPGQGSTFTVLIPFKRSLG